MVRAARAQSNTELLLGFGFVLPDNPQDLVAVAVGSDARDPLHTLREPLRAAARFERRHYLRRDGVVPEGAACPRRRGGGWSGVGAVGG